MVCCALAGLWLATAATPSGNEAAYAALVQRQAAFREASYAPAPSMPQDLVATNLAAFTVRDARLMDLPDGASGESRMLLVVSDVADVQESLFTGDWRGATTLTFELTAGAQAYESALTTLYDLHVQARPAPDTHAGIGHLSVLDKSCAAESDPARVRSGYVALSPTSDAERVHVKLNVGWGIGEIIQGELAARWMLRPAHVHGHQGPTCSPAFSALSQVNE